jgi:two-component system response regulator VicR
MTQKILIVEDEEDVAKGLELNLKKEGYRVVKAGRGDTAVDLAIKENPHLILLDVMLPGMSGLDVCRELRRERKSTGYWGSRSARTTTSRSRFHFAS